MKRYRLLVDWDVVTRMRGLPVRTQRQIYAIFSCLEEAPDLLSEFHEADENGRQLDRFSGSPRESVGFSTCG